MGKSEIPCEPIASIKNPAAMPTIAPEYFPLKYATQRTVQIIRSGTAPSGLIRPKRATCIDATITIKHANVSVYAIILDRVCARYPNIRFRAMLLPFFVVFFVFFVGKVFFVGNFLKEVSHTLQELLPPFCWRTLYWNRSHIGSFFHALRSVKALMQYRLYLTCFSRTLTEQ